MLWNKAKHWTQQTKLTTWPHSFTNQLCVFAYLLTNHLNSSPYLLVAMGMLEANHIDFDGVHNNNIASMINICDMCVNLIL